MLNQAYGVYSERKPSHKQIKHHKIILIILKQNKVNESEKSMKTTTKILPSFMQLLPSRNSIFLVQISPFFYL